MKRSKFLFWMLVLMSIVNVLDFLTMLPSKHLETNPVYLSNGIISLAIVKFCFMLLLWFIYFHNAYSNKYFIFCYSFFVVWSIFILGYFGTFFNLVVWLNPGILEVSRTNLVSNNSSYYNTIMTFFYLIPFILSSIVYFLYKSIFKYAIMKNDKR